MAQPTTPSPRRRLAIGVAGVALALALGVTLVNATGLGSTSQRADVEAAPLVAGPVVPTDGTASAPDVAPAPQREDSGAYRVRERDDDQRESAGRRDRQRQPVTTYSAFQQGHHDDDDDD